MIHPLAALIRRHKARYRGHSYGFESYHSTPAIANQWNHRLTQAGESAAGEAEGEVAVAEEGGEGGDQGGGEEAGVVGGPSAVLPLCHPLLPCTAVGSGV